MSSKAKRLILFFLFCLFNGMLLFYFLMSPEFNKDAYDRDYFGLSVGSSSLGLNPRFGRDQSEKDAMIKLRTLLDKELSTDELKAMGIQSEPVTFKTSNGRPLKGTFLPAKDAKRTVRHSASFRGHVRAGCNRPRPVDDGCRLLRLVVRLYWQRSQSRQGDYRERLRRCRSRVQLPDKRAQGCTRRHHHLRTVPAFCLPGAGFTRSTPMRFVNPRRRDWYLPN